MPKLASFKAFTWAAVIVITVSVVYPPESPCVKVAVVIWPAPFEVNVNVPPLPPPVTVNCVSIPYAADVWPAAAPVKVVPPAVIVEVDTNLLWEWI